jgi:glycosyltransferase A (GT-A) superfamily protein (DUF2064 family)
LTDARDRAAAVVVATAPRPGRCKTGLEPLLGPDGCARLQAVLIRRAAAWAAAVGTPYVAFAPGDARAEFEALVPAGTRLFEQAGEGPGDRLVAASDEVHAEHGGPVVLVGVDTPQLRPEVGRRALEDLREGCDATFGPTNAGGYYLVGLREPRPAVFDVPGGAWGGPELFGRTLEAAHRAGLSLGMLRAERELDDEGDARALLADPLAPADVVELLRSAVAR